MLTLDLTKNEMKLDLAKEAPGVHNITALMHWNMHPVHGASLTEGFDLDLFAFALNEHSHIEGVSDVIYFKNKTYVNESIVYPRDNRVGDIGEDDGEEGDGEEIIFALDKIPANRKSVAVYVIIFEAEKRGQHFGMMGNAHVDLIDRDADKVIARYNISQNYNGKTALHVGNLYKTGNDWNFEAIGEAAKVTANDIVNAYA